MNQSIHEQANEGNGNAPILRIWRELNSRSNNPAQQDQSGMNNSHSEENKEESSVN